MHVIKESGERERFNSKKLYMTMLNAGASKNLAREVLNLIKDKYFEGIKTKDILNLILKNLKKEKGVSQRYNLKKAIMKLGPTGFPFERYFARILNNYGYKTSVDNHIKGKRILQEIDIIAEKRNFKYMIECKYHNKHETHTNLHVAMYTYARFLDVNKFDKPWLVTNTKCVNDAINYAKGVNMKITSWNYPKINSLRELIEKKRLYPITILYSINNKTKQMFFSNNIIMAKDILNFTNKQLARKIGLRDSKIEKIKKEVKDVCELTN